MGAGQTSKERRDLEALAHWMDSVFRIPGVPLRFGLDAIIGLIPGFGDTATSAVSLYILHRAAAEGIPRSTMIRMAANIALDYTIGAIPILGDIFDVFFKVNRRNVDILRQHVEAKQAAAQGLAAGASSAARGAGPSPGAMSYGIKSRGSRGDRIFVGFLIAALILLLVGSITVAYLVLYGLGTLLFSGTPPAPH